MKKILIITLVLLSFTQAFAQTKTITGQVVGAADGIPLPGVSVAIVGTTKGTATDINGKFTLKVSASDKALKFTFIGFVSNLLKSFSLPPSLDKNIFTDPPLDAIFFTYTPL